MDVLVFALVLIGLAAFVAAPLYSQGPPRGPSPRTARDASTRRDVLLTALRDLEVDRASGLVTPSEYEAERGQLEAGAAALADEPRPVD